MKVLILSVTAGEGHNAAARAVGGAIEALGGTVAYADTYRKTCPFLHLLFSKGYPLVSKLLGPIYGEFYYGFEKRKANAYRSSPGRRFHVAVTKGLVDVFQNEAPDVVVCTHPFSAMLTDALIEKYGFPCRTLGVVTDFAPHPYWEEALKFDRLVIPHEHLCALAEKKGFLPEQILPHGIPVDMKFASKTDKSEARAALGLDPSLPTLLLIGGITGNANPMRVLRSLEELPIPMQTVVVAGKNRRLYRRLTKKKWKKPVRVLPFVSNLEEWMDAADLVAGKPGGLTSAEALAKGLPLLICNPIKGQEYYNRDFLASHAGAVVIDRHYTVKDAVKELFSSPDRIQELSARAAAVGRPDAANRIAEEVLHLCTTPSIRELYPTEDSRKKPS